MEKAIENVFSLTLVSFICFVYMSCVLNVRSKLPFYLCEALQTAITVK